MITTVIGAYPKPSFLKLPEWFKVEGGIDTEYPTEDYNKATFFSMNFKNLSIILSSISSYFQNHTITNHEEC